MNLDRSLLATFEERDDVPVDLHACINSHGLYHRVQFVMRLSPEVHRRLSGISPQLTNNSQVTYEQVQAFSTLLHETVHWWQHIGSTAGLLLSLSNPVQSHMNFAHLEMFLNEFGPKKSIYRFAQRNRFREPTLGTQAMNRIVNNYKDVSFYQIISTSPHLIEKQGITRDPLFESVGHSYYITYANTLQTLIDAFDPQHTMLQDPRKWEPIFSKFREAKKEGYYHGSRIEVFPVGLRGIFEGQARFVQLQYLFFAFRGRFNWESARENGMLGLEYISAFKWFLDLSELEWPSRIDSPIVALFLVVCDMTMNMGEGFPLPLRSPGTFIFDNDPATRFWSLCRMIKLKSPYLKDVIRNYSREEYLDVTQELCGHLCTPAPLEIAQTLSDWSNTKDSLVALMEEDLTFRFSEVNMPVRLLFSRYLTFNRDKASYPEILCWPGAWFAGDRVSENSKSIFERNRVLFVDKEDNDGVFPVIPPNRDPRIVQETFNLFYQWILNYDLISQWSVSDGPFCYPYRWLSTAHEPTEVEQWAATGFASIFGQHPDKFEILWSDVSPTIT